MKFRYSFGIILIGAMSLIVLVIHHWHELPSRFGGEVLQDVSDHVLPALANQENIELGVIVQTPSTADGPTDSYVEQRTEVKALVRFVNTNFEMAAKLYGERLELRQRRKPNGRYSPHDQKRLQEIHVTVYSYLKAIDDKIEGATQPYLSRRHGTVRCGYYLMPHKLKERLGRVPEGYYIFEKAIEPFLRDPRRK